MVVTRSRRCASTSRSHSLLRALSALVLAAAGAACAGGSTGAGGSTSTGITYGGPSRWTMVGPEGGPFSNSSTDIVLENRTDAPVSWSAAAVPSFVTLDQRNGVIQPHSQASIHGDLIVALAQNLVPGLYTELLAFHNDSAPQADVEIDVTVTVLTPGSSSQLVPPTNFASQGAAGGPFVPARALYSLINTGSTTLDWQAGASDPWIAIEPASGQLTPGDSVDVALVILAPATSALPIGVHHSVVEFRDAVSSALLHDRDVDVDILTDSSASGWTAFVPSADTRFVYVSSSTGNDANNGLSEGSAKASIWAGKQLLRNGFPDWLLLRKGDTWDEPVGAWGKSGRSLSERMILSSYGTSPNRPLIRTGTSTGLDMFDNGTRNDHVAIVGLHFWANLFNGGNGAPRGMQVYGGVRNLLIEDCYFQAFDTNLVIQGTPEGVGRHQNLAIRRNVIVDAYTTGGGNTAGLFASSIDGLLVEENVFDHNGWRDDVAGSWPTWFRRNVYIQNGNTGVVFRGNIVAGTDGIQMRPGGLMEDNLFLHNAIAMELGGGTNPELQGVSGTVRLNVVLDGRDLQAGSPRGWGLWLMNLTSSTVDSNVFAHNLSGHGPYPITFGTANGWMGNTRGVENTVFSNNVVYAWNGYSRFTGNAAQTVNVQLVNNKFQNQVTLDPLLVHDQQSSTSGVSSTNNVFDSMASPLAWMQIGGGNISLTQWKTLVSDTTSVAQTYPFPDPLRTIETYHLSIGGAPTRDAFMSAARLQSRSNWRIPYTAHAANEYIRAGYGL